ncbi:hypothetical protein J421_5723 (plasmid) [Gemmatirosa kalamazoonensis]|uniref:DUF4386 family protein n=1 Tax=Gemmatirosa kalamazoonensis TaxID=861299 RepID=W0RUL8_9BACT|nr:hypothetical protein [Gemmatirosa kalamazoonensis]AHG93258.1 hypothetical protein J421_5723 [Gemmatirosa kalamazoonensis]
MTPRRALSASAWVALAGTLASGPLGLWLVAATHPQPAWRDADTFARAFHPVQSVPFFCGFALVGGMVALIGCLHAAAPEALRPRAAVALALSAAFAAMVFANYAVQTTLVPALVRDASPGARAVLGTLTMANPRSLGWALEMWGYAVLGAATWLAAPVLRSAAPGRWSHTAAVLLVWNGPLSVATAVLTALRPGWVLGGVGLAAFGVWNALVVAMTLAAALAARERRPLLRNTGASARADPSGGLTRTAVDVHDRAEPPAADTIRRSLLL